MYRKLFQSNSKFMNIFWLTLSKETRENVLKKLLSFSEKSIVFTPNPEILLFAKKDREFLEMLKKANYLLPDGIGIFLAYQILQSKKHIFLDIVLLPFYILNLFVNRKSLYLTYWEKICGSDLTLDILHFAEKNNEKIVIIDLYNPGDQKKVANQKVFREKLLKKFPWLSFEVFIWEDEKRDEIIQNIIKSSAKIVFSTLGMKKQEKNIIEIMEKCQNVMVWLGVWSSFDYITWMQKRAPTMFQRFWIEWLYRLFTWPQKIKRFKRLWNAIIVFTFFVIIFKSKSRPVLKKDFKTGLD